MILGLSGLYGSGKGEIVRVLEARSFRAYSLSDVIREELVSRGLEETRERMIETGNAIRAAEGPGGLATRLATKLDPADLWSAMRPSWRAAVRHGGLRLFLVPGGLDELVAAAGELLAGKSEGLEEVDWQELPETAEAENGE